MGSCLSQLRQELRCLIIPDDCSWRKLLRMRDFLQPHFYWKIGNGEKVSLRHDSGILQGFRFKHWAIESSMILICKGILKVASVTKKGDLNWGAASSDELLHIQMSLCSALCMSLEKMMVIWATKDSRIHRSTCFCYPAAFIEVSWHNLFGFT